jgi:chromosomal replication initiation ATPase DnaA
MRVINWGLPKRVYIDIPQLTKKETNLESIILQLFSIRREEFYSKSRKQDLVDARRIMMHFLRPTRTLQAVANIFATDHANVLYHDKKFNDFKDTLDYSIKLQFINDQLNN